MINQPILSLCRLIMVIGMLFPLTIFGQQKSEYRGEITDSLNQPLSGVTISVLSTKAKTVSDSKGNFQIDAVQGDDLYFSLIGFQTHHAKLSSDRQLRIQMIQDVSSLSEVVVTGYSAQRKKDITGSVSVVDMSATKSIPTGSTSQALQGQASGVNVINPGAPGSAPNIFIRGVSSFGDASPLVLVDGVQTDLNNVNLNDIESIQVLKDAGAASIYGVRGANGVIVVTTKRGKSGVPTLSYNGYTGVQMPLSGNPYDIILDAEQFSKLALKADPNNALFKNGIPDYMYSGPAGSGIAWEGDAKVSPNLYNLDLVKPANSYLIQKTNKSGTNWFQETFDPAPINNHNVALSGGTEKSNYLFSLDYMDQKGTLKETYLKRYSARLNTSFKIGEFIEIGENLNMYYRQNPGFSDNGSFGVIAQTYSLMPLIPLHDIGGNYGGSRAGINLGSQGNPVAIQDRTRQSKGNSWNGAGNIYVNIKFLNDFVFRTSFGGALTNNYGYSFNTAQYENIQGFLTPNSFSESAGYSVRKMWTNTLTYSKSFNKHNIQAILGTESVENKGRNMSGSRRNYFSSHPDYLTLSTGTENIMNGSAVYENALFSTFGRVDYSFDDRYLIGGTVRRDGSSLFGPENRYGVFPSASAGWRISQEAFMKDVSWINDLKLRGSYGVLGSQNNISPENQFDLYGGDLGNAYYDIQGTSNSLVQGFIQVRSGNLFTSWERNIVSNVGLDATLFNNKIEFSAEYYKKSIDGLLFQQTLPGTAGYASRPSVNIGDIQNTGADFSLKYNGSSTNGFNYSIGTNITFYNNKVKSVPSPGYFDAASHQQLGLIVRNQIGHAVSSFYGYDVVGLFSNDEEVQNSATQNGAAPGRFKYRDVNNDGQINSDDRTFIGDPNPDFTYGINLAAQYKGFDFSTVLYGSQGNEAVNTVPVYTHFFGTYVSAKSNVLNNAWTPENLGATVPKIESQNSFSTAGVFNSYFVEDASYLRMKSLVLGYTFSDSKFLRSINNKKLRVYLQASNLFTITKYSGIDPELSGGSSSFGIDNGAYPSNERGFMFGLNLIF